MEINVENLRNLCSEFLSDCWSKIPLKEFKFDKITNGFVNTKYILEIPTDANNNNQSENDEINKVIIHVDGNEVQSIKQITRFIKSEIDEAIVAQCLGLFEIGPKVFGFFDGGRIEEFIEGKTMRRDDLMDEKNLKKIATKLAKLHTLQMPLKRQVSFCSFLHNIVNKTPMRSDVDQLEGEFKRLCVILDEFNVKEELKWLNEHYKIINAPIVFSHNDLNGNNIMRNSDGDVKFVDWDFTAYNYRGYDLAYFLIMKDLEYKIEESRSKLTIYEATKDCRAFLEAYTDEYKRLLKKDHSRNNLNFDLDRLTMETEFFKLSVAMFFVSFAYIAMMNTSDVQVFNNRYLDNHDGKHLGEYMMTVYKEEKKRFTSKYKKFLSEYNQ